MSLVRRLSGAGLSIDQTQTSTAASLMRRILLAVTALLMLGLGVVAALLLAAATGQDDVAAAASRRAVQAALATLQRRMVSVAGDYAYWDEAVDNLHVAFNREWAEQYVDSVYLDTVEIDGCVVFTPGDRVLYSITREGLPDLETAVATDPVVLRLVQAARALGEDERAAAGFAVLDGALHVVSTSRIRYTGDHAPAPGAGTSVFLMARRLEEGGLQVLATDHALEPLRFDRAGAAESSELRLPIVAFGADEHVGDLVWQPERPGKALLHRILAPVGLAVCLMIILLLNIARTARRAGAALDAASAQLAEARETLEQKVVERTEALQRAEARFRSIFDNSAEGVFQLGEDGRYLSVNPAMASIFGYASVDEFLAEAPDHTCEDQARRREFIRLMQTFGKVSDFISQGRQRDGAPIWLSQNARAVVNADGSRFYEGMLTDITHRKRIEERLVHDALHDALTGLPNRKLFEERLSQSLARAGANGHRPAVLLIDCDRFKLINDSLGHAAGDDLLIVLAQRLSLCLRATDTLARLGGDEFAVLTDDVDANCQRLAERFQETCRRPFMLGGREIIISLSVGAAVLGDEPAQPSELVRNADIAMYQAKARGRGTAVLFTPEMHSDVLNRMRIESELRRALTNDELRVIYQPIIEFEGGQVAGFEALVRWQHPERGLISPNEFIPIAEESSMIVTLGEIVLRKAAADLASWIRDRPVSDSLFVTVNISPVQLTDGHLVQLVAEILREQGLPAHRLKLELTESAMMSDPIEVRAKLDALADLGIELCIDDFGTGYSSLSQLHNYPFNTLKIDRSFIAKLTSGGDGMAVVRSILTLAKNMRLTVVAEGVEYEAQREWLRAEGCTFGQGFHFARPIPATDAQALLPAPLQPRAVA